MVGEEGTGSPPSTLFEEKLDQVVEGEARHSQGAARALERCLDAESLEEIQSMRDAAARLLQVEREDLRKRYLFGYIEQFERVLTQIAGSRAGRFDA